MCRLAAYVGPPRSLQSLWLAPAHNLVVQSYAPREMNGALLNADGFGMAWYTAAAPEPALYRTVLPLWGDENVTRMAPHLESGCAIANVRSATPGMGIQSANVSPFVSGRFAFTHNGVVRAFPRLARRLREMLDDERFGVIEGNTDSEHVFALVLMHLARGAELAGAVRGAMNDLEGLLAHDESGALLNVMLTDGRSLVALRHAVGAPAPSLYRRDRRDGGLEVASEPLDADGWEPVAEGSLLVAEGGEVRCERL